VPIPAGAPPSGAVAGTALVIVADGHTGRAGTMTGQGILGPGSTEGQHGTHAPSRRGHRRLEDGAAGDRVRQLPGQLIELLIFHPRYFLP
jgi:hypothetical protein